MSGLVWDHVWSGYFRIQELMNVIDLVAKLSFGLA
jgi:hypothetical protein